MACFLTVKIGNRGVKNGKDNHLQLSPTIQKGLKSDAVSLQSGCLGIAVVLNWWRIVYGFGRFSKIVWNNS